MDTKTRAMVLPGKSGVEVPGILRDLEAATPGSIVPKPLENTVCHCVGYSLLDRNGHMNNTRYLDWIDDLLPADFHAAHPVRELSLCYLSEAREGQQISLDWELTDTHLLAVELHRPKEDDSGTDERVFAAHVQF